MNVGRNMCALALISALGSAPALAAISAEAAIAEVQRTLDAPLQLPGAATPPGLAARMTEVPLRGISIAVIHEGKLHWARGFGQAREGVPVTADTRFQAASISKPIAALGALAIAKSRKVGLDDDLRPMLRRWKPAAEQPEPATPRYTLRRLLSHSAGLDQHGFPGYARDAALPTTPQILDGLPPANTGPVRPAQPLAPPGQGFRYSGGGSTIVQLWVEDLTQQPFAQQMQQWVLNPLQMSSSHFGPPASADDKRYAHSHQGLKPEPGGWRVYPELQAAGLWTTPTDLAKALIATQRALAGQSSPLDTQLARTATTSAGGPASPGFFLDGATGKERRFGHNGSNQGFESVATAYFESGEGVVIMANGQGNWALMEALVRTLGRIYSWPGLASQQAAADQSLSPQAQRWPGVYAGESGLSVDIRQRDGALWRVSGGGLFWQRLWLSTQNQTLATTVGDRMSFDTEDLRIADRSGSVTLKRAKDDTQPPVPAMFLRGSFNQWGTDTALQSDGIGQWSAVLQLPAGRIEFKVGDTDWRSVDLGGDRDTPTSGPQWNTLRERGLNLSFDAPQAGPYRFILRTGSTTAPPALRVEELR